MSTLIRPEITKKSKYYISKERYYELKHFCMQYREWQAEVTNVRYVGGVRIEVRNRSEWSDPTCETALYLDKCKRNIRLVEETVMNTDGELYLYLMKSLTEGRTYENLYTAFGIPCCRDTFYDRYRKFFWLLDKTRG